MVKSRIRMYNSPTSRMRLLFYVAILWVFGNEKELVLEKAGMNFTHNEKSTGKNFTGITIVVLLHVLVAYGIITGLGTRLVAKMIAPVETKIIEEVTPPPPKELPPPPPPPEMKAPPPPFIPPVEVNVQQPPPQQNVIANATNVKPPRPSSRRHRQHHLRRHLARPKPVCVLQQWLTSALAPSRNGRSRRCVTKKPVPCNCRS